VMNVGYKISVDRYKNAGFRVVIIALFLCVVGALCAFKSNNAPNTYKSAGKVVNVVIIAPNSNNFSSILSKKYRLSKLSIMDVSNYKGTSLYFDISRDEVNSILEESKKYINYGKGIVINNYPINDDWKDVVKDIDDLFETNSGGKVVNILLISELAKNHLVYLHKRDDVCRICMNGGDLSIRKDVFCKICSEHSRDTGLHQYFSDTNLDDNWRNYARNINYINEYYKNRQDVHVVLLKDNKLNDAVLGVIHEKISKRSK